MRIFLLVKNMPHHIGIFVIDKEKYYRIDQKAWNWNFLDGKALKNIISKKNVEKMFNDFHWARIPTYDDIPIIINIKIITTKKTIKRIPPLPNSHKCPQSILQSQLNEKRKLQNINQNNSAEKLHEHKLK